MSTSSMVKRDALDRAVVAQIPAVDVLNYFIVNGITVISQHSFKGQFGHENVHELGECTVSRRDGFLIFEHIRNRKHVWKIKEADFVLTQMDATSVRFSGERDEYVLFERVVPPK